ncbi:MAG: 2-oxo acid dehydrogenase subunit E2 [Chloroflexi bacterium]|nr:2-oxo acid dehydrogenase subunit E2 [Chloroflexota bacterium]
MATTSIAMPSFGQTTAEGRVVTWLKREGERVERGDALVEVETDKAVVAVEAFTAGYLRQILCLPDAVVSAGQVIAVVTSTVDEPIEDDGMTRAAANSLPEQPRAVGAAPDRRILATPTARRLADELGVNLALVVGSGPGGRILENDVRTQSAAARRMPVPSDVAPSGGTEEQGDRATERGGDGRAEYVELSALRRAMGARMVRSVREAPQFALSVDADLTEVARLRSPSPLSDMGSGPGGMGAHLGPGTTALGQISPPSPPPRVGEGAWGERSAPAPPGDPKLAPMGPGGEVRPRGEDSAGRKPSYTAVLVRVVATALRRHPEMNVAYEDGRLRRCQEVNVGVAMATPRGLLVPVIREADRRSLDEIGATIDTLRAQAAEGRLPVSAASGGTFTLSNLGMYGIDQFTAILNPPEVGILAVGRVGYRPVSVGALVESRLMVTLTLTVDHRAVDGVEAATFLATVRHLLEKQSC